MTFLSDLKDGINIEDEFVNFMNLSTGQKATRNTATSLAEQRLYDVFLPDSTLYEIKFDKMWKRTGNVYIEDNSILRSKSDYVVYRLREDEHFYSITKEGLLALLQFGKKVKGGDQNAIGTLLPLETFKLSFQVL